MPYTGAPPLGGSSRSSGGSGGYPELTGRDTGRIPTQDAALSRMVQNAPRAQRLLETGDYEGADKSFLETVVGGGLWLFDKSGLDSALEFVDRARKTVSLAASDNPVFDQLASSGLMAMPKLVTHANRFFDEGQLQGADQLAGYEITAADYFDTIKGDTEAVVARMNEKAGEGTAEQILGENLTYSASAVMDSYGYMTSDWGDDLWSWDIPVLGMFDPKSLYSSARFLQATSQDMANDPITYVTGGLGGIGRPTARMAIAKALEGSMRTTTKKLIASGADDALALITREVEQGMMSSIDAYAARRIVARASKLVETGTAKTWDEAVEKAAGASRVGYMPKIENGKVVSGKGTAYPLAEGDIRMTQGVYSEMKDELAHLIETKAFDSKDELWQVWKSYAKKNQRLLYTTGGLRSGIGFSSFEIPYVTDATRGLIRKGQRKITQSAWAQAKYQTPGWQTWSDKWTKFRSVLSREAPEAIRAAGGKSKWSYSGYMAAHKDAPQLAVRALTASAKDLDVAVTGSYHTVVNAVEEALGEAGAAEFMRAFNKSVASGTTPDLTLISAGRKTGVDVKTVGPAEAGERLTKGHVVGEDEYGHLRVDVDVDKAYLSEDKAGGVTGYYFHTILDDGTRRTTHVARESIEAGAAPDRMDEAAANTARWAADYNEYQSRRFAPAAPVADVPKTKAVQAAEAFTKLIEEDVYQEWAKLLRLIDPEMAKTLTSGNWRPLAMTEDFIIQLNDIVSLKTERLPDFAEVVDGKYVGPAKVAALLSDGDVQVTRRGVEALMAVMATARDSVARTRPFGETAEMNWRKLGRHTQAVDNKIMVEFETLEILNDEIQTAFNQLKKYVEYDTKASKRWVKEHGTAIELNPVVQAQRYAKDMEQMVTERAMIAEAMHWKLATQPVRTLDPGLLGALLAEDQLLAKTLAAAVERGDITTAQGAREAMLHLDIMEVALPGSNRVIRVSRTLLQDPDYNAAVETLLETWDEMVRVQASFPHAYEDTIRRLEAKGLSNAEAHVQAQSEMLTNLGSTEARLRAETYSILTERQRQVGEVLDNVGFEDAVDAQAAKEAYFAQNYAATNQMMADYRRAYIDKMTNGQTDRVSIDLLGSEEIDQVLSMIEKKGVQTADDMLQSAQDVVESRMRRVQEAELEGASLGDRQIARQELRRAELHAEVLEAQLAGEQLPAHHIGAVSMLDDEFFEGFAAQVTDPNVRVVNHWKGTDELGELGERHANRLYQMRKADYAIIFYHPSMTSEGDWAARLLRYRVTGESVATPVANPEEWFKKNMVKGPSGTWLPRAKTRPDGTKINAIVISEIGPHEADRNAMINMVHRETTRVSDDLGRDVSVVIEKPDEWRLTTHTVKKAARSPKQIAADYIDQYPGWSRDELVDKIMADNSDALKWRPRVKPGRTPIEVEGVLWEAKDAPLARRAIALGFVFDLDEGEWVLRDGVTSGTLQELSPTGAVVRESPLGDWYPILNVSEDDLAEMSVNFPQYLDDEIVAEFPETALPDAPKVATIDEQRAAAGADAVEVADDVEELTRLQESLEKKLFKAIERLEAAEATGDTKAINRIRYKEVVPLEDKAKRLQLEIDAIDLGKEMNRKATEIPSVATGKGIEEQFNVGIGEMADEMAGRPSRITATRLDSIEAALRRTLYEKGVTDEVAVSQVVEEYKAALVAAQADVADVGTSTLGAARIDDIIRRLQKEKLNEINYRNYDPSTRFTKANMPSRPVRHEAYFPPGTKVQLPDKRTLMESRVRYGFEVDESVPRVKKSEPEIMDLPPGDVPAEVKRRANESKAAWEKRVAELSKPRAEQPKRIPGAQYSVDEAVLRSRRHPSFQRQTANDVRRNWDMPPRPDADTTGMLHTWPTDDLRKVAKGYRERSMDGRPWYNPETHITIGHAAKDKPKGAVDVGRGGGMIADVTNAADKTKPVFTLNEKGFGNPFVVAGRKTTAKPGQVLVATEAEAVDRYIQVLWEGIKSDPAFADRVADLSGRELFYFRGSGRMTPTHSEPLADAADYLASLGYGSKKAAKGTYEVSTKGDKRFSALNARIKGRGNRTIEEIYQVDIKGYDSIKAGKGKPPKPRTFETEPGPFGGGKNVYKPTRADMENEYTALWREWAEENPELIDELAKASAGMELTDRFAKEGSVSQARSLQEIIDERQAAPDAAVPTRPPVEKPQPVNKRPVVAPLDDTTIDTMSEKQMRQWFRNKELEEKALYKPNHHWDEVTGSSYYDKPYGGRPELGPGGELGADPPVGGRELTELERRAAKQEYMEQQQSRLRSSTSEFVDDNNLHRLDPGNKPYTGHQKDVEQVYTESRDSWVASNADTLLARQDMPKFVSEAIGLIFGRSTRSGADRLADGNLERLLQAVQDGTTGIYHQEYPFDGVQQAFTDHAINQEAIAAFMRRIDAGDIEPLYDPQFLRAMAITSDHHTWRNYPDVYKADHGGTHPKIYPGLDDETLFELTERFQNGIDSFMAADQIPREADQIAQQVTAADTNVLAVTLRKLRKITEVEDLVERARQTDELLDEIGDQADALQGAVKSVYGDDAMLTIVRDTGEGPALVVDFPYSDQIALETQFGGDFDQALAAMMHGDLTPADAYRGGLSNVAKAYETYRALEDALDAQNVSLDVTTNMARKENLRDFYRTVMAEAQSAIDRRNVNKLKKLVSKRSSQGVYQKTPEYEQLLEALADTPQHQEFLARMVDSAFVAGLKEWDSEAAFRAWWLEERRSVAALSWSLEENVTRLNRETSKLLEFESTLHPPEEVATRLSGIEDLILALGQLERRTTRTYMGPDNAFGKAGFPREEIPNPAMGGVEARDASRTRKAKFGQMTAGDIESTEDALNLVMRRINEQINAYGEMTLPLEVRAEAASSIESLRRLYKEYEKVATSARIGEAEAPQGMVLAEAAGLGSGLTAGLAIDPLFATLLETTVNNSKTLFTPYAVSEISRTGRSIVNWWKSAATVPRPSFHIRNLIGGITNGYIIGVHGEEYVPMFIQTTKFRRALKKLEVSGAEQIGPDVFEREVIGAVDEGYREVFRRAWADNVMQTSFTRAEQLYTPGSALSWKPWDRNFAAFQWGGRTMEAMEDMMRMTAFKHHFDRQVAEMGAAGATSYAHSMVNVAHFDYTSLTSVEQNIKKIMPFYVWTRRNIPLQLRVLTQNPTFMLWYQRARDNWNEQQLSQLDGEGDPFLTYQASQGFMMPTMRSNDDGWARLIWNPQLPMYDLDRLPIWDGDGTIPIGMSAFNMGNIFASIIDSIGPGISLPFQMAQANDDGGNTNAKAGLNAIVAALDAIPIIGSIAPDRNPSPSIGLAPDHDYRINKWISEGINTAVPFYDDYRAMLGIRPNSPYRAAGEGWLPGEEQSVAIVERLLLGPLGRVTGRGAGFQWATNTDAMFAAYETADRLDQMETAARFRMGAPTEPETARQTAEEMLAQLGY